MNAMRAGVARALGFGLDGPPGSRHGGGVMGDVSDSDSTPDVLGDLIREASREGASVVEIAAALGVGLPEVRAALATAPADAPTDEELAEPATRPVAMVALDVIQEQIRRAEMAVQAATSAGDTTGARVWAGIVARLAPLLFRASEAQKGDGLTVSVAELHAARETVRERTRLALAKGDGK